MHEQHEEMPRRRVEFRVVCVDQNGTELIWKYTEALENALHYLKNLNPKYQANRKCLIYEVQVIEIIRTVYTLDAQTAGEADTPEAD
jgi:hypothetical protein